MSLTAGSRLGPYEIVAPLGAGGMGEVYRARDTRLNRDVALKVLVGEATEDSGRFRRFQSEAESTAALAHPNIVAVYDIGQENGVPYIVSELVSGGTLASLLARGPVGVRRLLDLAVPIAEGLAAAHANGIVHRDLKPDNILLTADGSPKIADFGLAKYFRPAQDEEGSQLTTLADDRTKEGTIVGTVSYMSPEQAKGEPVDYRSDQFSFGSLLYEMATGKRAFRRETAVQTLAAIVQDEPEPIGKLNPALPAPLRWIIERCFAKEPKAPLRFDGRPRPRAGHGPRAPGGSQRRGGGDSGSDEKKAPRLATRCRSRGGARRGLGLRLSPARPPALNGDLIFSDPAGEDESGGSGAVTRRHAPRLYRQHGRSLMDPGSRRDRGEAEHCRRGGLLSLLVARRPLRGLLQRREVEESRLRRRVDSDHLRRGGGRRWELGNGRHHPLCADECIGAVQSLRLRRTTRRSDEAGCLPP